MKNKNIQRENMTLEKILKEIKNSEIIVVLTHESPDGDAVGSSMSTKLILEACR